VKIEQSEKVGNFASYFVLLSSGAPLAASRFLSAARVYRSASSIVSQPKIDMSWPAVPHACCASCSKPAAADG